MKEHTFYLRSLNKGAFYWAGVEANRLFYKAYFLLLVF